MENAPTRTTFVTWLGTGLAAGVVIGLVRVGLALAATKPILGWDFVAVAARQGWWYAATHGAAGVGLAAGAALPGLMAGSSAGWRRVGVLAAGGVIGAAGLAGALVWKGAGLVYRVGEALAPALPRGSAAGLGLCAAVFLGLGLAVSPALARIACRWPGTRGAGRLCRAAGVGGLVVLGALGVATTAAPPPRLNVVFITLDALRADHLGCYGYDRDTSPNIDRLAARGTLFLDANANAPWTLPSVASIDTGKLPMEHGVTTGLNAMRQDERTLAELLRDCGYKTGGVFASGWVAQPFNMTQGFGFLVGHDLDEANARLMIYDVPRWVTSSALQFMRQSRRKPFYLRLHYVRPHDPYMWHPKHNFINAPPDDLPKVVSLGWLIDHLARVSPTQMQHIKDLYDGGIHYADEHVGKLLAELRRLGLAGRTVVIVSADHGEEFEDHGSFGHRQLYQEVLRVPLIIAAPGWLPGGRRCVEPVQSIDLRPTILDLCAVSEQIAGLRGQSLMPLLAGRRGYEPRDIIASLSELMPSGDVHVTHSIRHGKWKLVLRVQQRKFELYDLAADAAEKRNLADRRLPIQRELAIELALLSERPAPPRATLSKEVQERLRALGYLQ